MWIVANGAPKSGSTWIFQILTATGAFLRLPERFQDPRWLNLSVADRLVGKAADFLCAAPQSYISKQHWADRNAGLAARPGIRIVNIIRDIRDTVVSRYHHDVRTAGYQGGISAYLETNLEKLIRDNVAYHAYWMDAGTAAPGSYYITSYEYLTDDYLTAGRALVDFCATGLAPEKIAAALEASRFENKKVTGPGAFFRKGRAFAFGDDLTGAEAGRILEVARDAGLPQVKARIAGFNPALRPWLERTDCGLA